MISLINRLKDLKNDFMKFTPEYIKKECFKSTGDINTVRLNKLLINPEFKAYLDNYYNDIPKEFFSYKEVVYRIKNNIDVRPVCPICGKPTIFRPKGQKRFGRIYTITCQDKTCESLYKKDKIGKTVKNQYNIYNKIKNDIDNFNDYSDTEKEIYNKILIGIENKNNAYKSYQHIKKLINVDKMSIDEVKSLYPDEFIIYERLNNGLNGVRCNNIEMKSHYDFILNLLENNQEVDYNSKEYHDYLTIKESREKSATKIRNNYKCYRFVIEKLKTLSEDKILSLYPIEYKNYISYKNKIFKNKSRYSNYNFILEKINRDNISIEKCKELYPDAYNDYLKCLDINSKINETLKNNQTYNTSNGENMLYEILKELFPSVIRNYKDELYPFNCDFYIPEKRLYIEYQGSMFHNNKQFNEIRDKDELENIKVKADNIRADNKINRYDNLISTWTIRDVNKRNIAKNNKLNYLEIFPKFELTFDNVLYVLDKFSNLTHKQLVVGDLIEEQYNIIFRDEIENGLQLNISEDEIKNEFNKLSNTNGTLSSSPNTNKIVLYFQENNFYKKEKELFSTDYILRRQLIENRCKYLNKLPEELTNSDLIRGFRISRLYNSYSHFSPLWVKYFIQKYNIKSIIDPFGGWGHHVLGILGTDCKYHYSDISKETVDNVSEMIKYFNLNVTCEISSAENVNINDVDAVFMCPPYFNIEEYETSFNNIDEYNTLIYSVINNWLGGNVDMMGIIIREDFEYLFDGIKNKLISKEIVNNSNDQYNKSGKLNEYFYVFKK